MSHTNSPAATRSARPVGAPRNTVQFWFEGRRFRARPDDSIAKALFDNGIRTLSHSVKYGRPRGIHCGRGRCVMCLVEVDGKTGVKSCLTPVADGMRIRRQNFKPFYGNLMTRILGRLTLPAGFYYRWFTRPRWIRNAFVDTVRRIAGVGRIDERSPQPRRLPPAAPELGALAERYDVVVVGSGVSGMAAAVSAADAGAGVLLVDEYAFPGGHAVGYQVDPGHAAARDELIQRSASAPGIRTLRPATAYGFYPPDRLLIGRDSRGGSAGGLRTVSATALVFATGALDVTPLFENNDLPGVFGARAIRLFIERDDLVPGNNAVVYGVGTALENTAGLLRSRGVRVSAVVDARASSAGGRARPGIGFPPNARYRRATTLIRAEGRDWISRAVFADGSGDPFSLPCDLLCIAVPGQPSFELAQQAGIGFRFEESPSTPELRVLSPAADALNTGNGGRVLLAGEAAGIVDWEQKLEHAASAGLAAAETAGARAS